MGEGIGAQKSKNSTQRNHTKNDLDMRGEFGGIKEIEQIHAKEIEQNLGHEGGEW